MNLNGSITDLQKAAIQLYLKLKQRFKENALIRELWSSMAQDMMQQKDCLKALPSSFWNHLQKERSELIQAAVPYVRLQVTDNIKDMPLKSCIESALQFEEPTILKVYIPIIRSLRENRAESTQDFYIMVKAHLSRIVSMTSAFSGDPILIQRSNLLLQRFERDVQEPLVDMSPPVKKARLKKAHAKPAAKPKPAAKKPSKPKKAAKPKPAAKKPSKPQKAKSRGSTMAKRAKTHHHRPKRIVKKVAQRRRARR